MPDAMEAARAALPELTWHVMEAAKRCDQDIVLSVVPGGWVSVSWYRDEWFVRVQAVGIGDAVKFTKDIRGVVLSIAKKWAHGGEQSERMIGQSILTLTTERVPDQLEGHPKAAPAPSTPNPGTFGIRESKPERVAPMRDRPDWCPSSFWERACAEYDVCVARLTEQNPDAPEEWHAVQREVVAWGCWDMAFRMSTKVAGDDRAVGRVDLVGTASAEALSAYTGRRVAVVVFEDVEQTRRAGPLLYRRAVLVGVGDDDEG